jgi:excisionase family DNA binding protein
VTTRTTWTPTATPALSVKVEARAAGEQEAAWHLLSIKDVAAACRLSEKAVRRAIDDGELPAVKLRSRLRISPADLAAWIESGRRDSARPDTTPRARTRRPHPAATFRALLQADANRQVQR